MSIAFDEDPIEEAICSIIPLKIDENSMTEIGGVLSNCMYDSEYSPNGKFLLISYGYIGGASIVETKTKRVLHTFEDHSKPVCGISISQDGHMLSTCSGDCSIIIYNATDFSIMKRLRNNSAVNGICFSHCCNYIYSGDNNGIIKKWDICSGDVVLENNTKAKWIWRLKISSWCNYILAVGYESDILLVNGEDLSVVHIFPQKKKTLIRTVEFHPTQRIFATGGQSYKVNLWDMDTGSHLQKFDFGANIFALHFLNSTCLLVLSGNGFITLIDLNSYQIIQKIYCDCDRSFFSFAISPDKSKLACGRCAGDMLRFYSLTRSYEESSQSELVELAKNCGGNVLSILINMNMNTKIIRQLVSAGIIMNQNDYFAVVDTCWDLVDFNEANGGNMYSFMNEPREESDDD
eukprot:TRINITY_DN3176_c3_g5_i1.p1 TRINITY_DN3176_c3_g5~~TRINITY_DN3176_c3_g5_i1.p1  ORF type:complete len:415 (-),score=63.11 TRINITY_DN3176_c3_g5_i1:143-1357(-)